ncbi:MAG: hypothetical protein Q7J56_03520 [Deltaproteobacteria bacterium]|nr:hypothetical protein [Deltaproteobacteria bacterium]
MINFWARYDLSKAAAFMAASGWRLRCAVLTIGPLGFAVIWKRRADAKAEKDDRSPEELEDVARESAK